MEEGFSEYLAMIRVCSDASPSPATFSDVRVSYATSAGSATSVGTMTNGVYTSSSVTALNDVSSAGSGVIITTAERTKLGGIATSADVTGSNTAANTNKITSIGSQPASTTTTCTKGQMWFSDSFFYICTNTDTWRRVSLSTWP